MIEINGKEYRNLPQQVAKNANDIEELQDHILKHCYVTTASYLGGSAREENAEYWQYQFYGTITFLTTKKINSASELKHTEAVGCVGMIEKYDDDTDVRNTTIFITWGGSASGDNTLHVVGSDKQNFEIKFSNPLDLTCRQLF